MITWPLKWCRKSRLFPWLVLSTPDGADNLILISDQLDLVWEKTQREWGWLLSHLVCRQCL